MNKYHYYYVYDVCGSHATGHKNKASQMIYIGNGRIKFFECPATDILEADKQLASFCELQKLNWNIPPFSQVVVWIEFGQ